MSDQELKPCQFQAQKTAKVVGANGLVNALAASSYHCGTFAHLANTYPGDYADQRNRMREDTKNLINFITAQFEHLYPDPMLEELANRLNNCLVILEDYQGTNADMKMIEKSRLSLQKYQQAKKHT